MSHENLRELLDLSAVHSFYIALLESTLGHPIPLPRDAMEADSTADRVEHSLSTLRRFLNVLDLAVSPAMVRDAVKSEVPQELAEALLRYYARKKAPTGPDRDKADLIVTSVCRTARYGERPLLDLVPSSHQFEEVNEAALMFEGSLRRVLTGIEFAALSAQQKQLVSEFQYLHQEVEDFRSFEQLIDSGIIQRVRQLKDSLGEAFYHPQALATAAVYNAVFGRRFDELFHKAAEQIRSFAEKLQSEGASIFSKVEGDVTVKNLTEIEGGKILNAEYGAAKEEFRKVAKAKRAIDRRRGTRPPAPPPQPERPMPTADPEPRDWTSQPSTAASDATGAAPAESEFTSASQVLPRSGNNVEEGKFKMLREQIRALVRASQNRGSAVVPLQKGTLVLTPAEADAFRPDFGNEKSFRVDYATALTEVVTAFARFTIELAEFRAKEKSEYLWKPHADSLAFLLTMVPTVQQRAQEVLQVAQQRGLAEKVATLNTALQKLSREANDATNTLSNLQTRA